jgi:hypothetical protein
MANELTNVPRILDAFQPGEGQYLVAVRVPVEMASQFPSVPWGSPLSDLGIKSKDADKFADYELVDIERIQDSSHLLYFYQKLPGPVWSTTAKAAPDLTPAKYKRFVTNVKTEQEVDPATVPDELTGDLESSVVAQQPNTGKATKTNTTEEVDENVDPLEGQLTDTWGINTTEEQLVDEGTAVNSGYGFKSSRVTPLGNGKSIKETENYPADVGDDGIIYTLIGREVDETTDAVIQVEKSLVDASRALALAAAADGYAELQPIDKWHSIMLVSKVIVAPANRTWKETGSISLPNRLSEVGVIWDSDIQVDEGSAGVDSQSDVIANNLGWSATAEASVVGSVFGRPYTKVVAGFNGMAEVTVTRTFHTEPPVDDIEAHIFEPVYGTITLHGVQGQQQVQGMAKGVGDIQTGNSVNYRSHYDTKLAITQFGPFEFFPGLTLTESGDPNTVTDTATASGGTTPGAEPYPTAVAGVSLTGSATLELPASSTPLVAGDEFILSVNVSPWRYGYWVKETRTAKVPGTPPP